MLWRRHLGEGWQRCLNSLESYWEGRHFPSQSQLIHVNSPILHDYCGLAVPLIFADVLPEEFTLLGISYENYSTFYCRFVRCFAGEHFRFNNGRRPLSKGGGQTPVHRAAGHRTGWSFVCLRSQGGLHHRHQDRGQADRQPLRQFQGRRLERQGGGCPGCICGSSPDH